MIDANIEGREYNFLDILAEKLADANPMHPESAPNYRQIPANKDREVLYDKKGNVRVLTSSELSTGKFVPQNFSSKPYNLENFPAASDSLDKTEDDEH